MIASRSRPRLQFALLVMASALGSWASALTCGAQEAKSEPKGELLPKYLHENLGKQLGKFYGDFFEFSKDYKFDPRETTQKPCSVTWVVTAKTNLGRNEIAILRFMAETHVLVFKDKEGVVINDLEQSQLAKHSMLTTLRLAKGEKTRCTMLFPPGINPENLGDVSEVVVREQRDD
jgi:hypothetical protein